MYFICHSEVQLIYQIWSLLISVIPEGWLSAFVIMAKIVAPEKLIYHSCA